MSEDDARARLALTASLLAVATDGFLFVAFQLGHSSQSSVQMEIECLRGSV